MRLHQLMRKLFDFFEDGFQAAVLAPLRDVATVSRALADRVVVVGAEDGRLQAPPDSDNSDLHAISGLQHRENIMHFGLKSFCGLKGPCGPRPLCVWFLSATGIT
jgi:hypothetical protein